MSILQAEALEIFQESREKSIASRRYSLNPAMNHDNETNYILNYNDYMSSSTAFDVLSETDSNTNLTVVDTSVLSE